MTREQATTTVAKATGISGPYTDNFVIGLEALGLLKLEEAKAACFHFVPATQLIDNGRTLAMGTSALGAYVREDTLIETLRMAGYTVLPK